MELSLTLEQVIEFLLETPLFEDLDAGELGEVVRVMQIQRVRPDHAIFKEGDAGNAWYVIYEGEAGVEKRDPFSPVRKVATLGDHACFGEMAVLDDSPRSATVTARTDVTLFRFPSIPFQDLLEEVRDIQNRQSFVAQLSQDHKQSRRVFSCQRTGGLVEDEDACIRTQGAGDLDDLTICQRQVEDPCAQGGVLSLQASQRDGAETNEALRRECLTPSTLPPLPCRATRAPLRLPLP